MVEVRVEGEIAVTADRVWKIVQDFGDVSWIKGVTRVETKGQGVGMERLIYAGDAPAVREVLESCDPAAKRIGYTIPEGNPLPVKNYHATVTVGDAGAGKTRLQWACRCEPNGVSEEQAEGALKGMYGVLIDWVRAAAESS